MPAKLFMKKKRPKYRNKKVTVDGVTYDSGAEYARWLELQTLARMGQIKNLRRQVTYRLEVNGVLVCRYKADAVYFACRDGCEVIEDVKGFVTREFKIKKKLMLACHGITIKEIKKGK